MKLCIENITLTLLQIKFTPSCKMVEKLHITGIIIIVATFWIVAVMMMIYVCVFMHLCMCCGNFASAENNRLRSTSMVRKGKKTQRTKDGVAGIDDAINDNTNRLLSTALLVTKGKKPQRANGGDAEIDDTGGGTDV